MSLYNFFFVLMLKPNTLVFLESFFLHTFNLWTDPPVRDTELTISRCLHYCYPGLSHTQLFLGLFQWLSIYPWPPEVSSLPSNLRTPLKMENWSLSRLCSCWIPSLPVEKPLSSQCCARPYLSCPFNSLTSMPDMLVPVFSHLSMLFSLFPFEHIACAPVRASVVLSFARNANLPNIRVPHSTSLLNCLLFREAFLELINNSSQSPNSTL